MLVGHVVVSFVENNGLVMVSKSFGFIRHLLAVVVVVDDLLQFFGAEGNRVARQFWHVVALQEQCVLFWVFLRQEKRLVVFPVAVEIGDVGAGIIVVAGAMPLRASVRCCSTHDSCRSRRCLPD